MSFSIKIHVNFLNLPFSIIFYPLSIHADLFKSPCQSRSMAIFSNHLISISSAILHQFTLIFFYLFVNLNSRLSFLISPFLSHSILHLSTSIFFYLFINLNSRLSSSIPLFYLILSFIYQGQSLSIFLPI